MTQRALLAAAVPAPVIQICERLAENGFRGWLVGGAVRDILMAPSVHDQVRARNDWDVATDARPDQVQKLFRRVLPTGIKHGTVTVLIGRVGYELTTLRGEGTYSDGRRPDSVNFVNDIEGDLARRDFTMNAIAYDPLDGLLVDPYGGLADIEARCLRAVGDPSARFSEDGLRVLRAARFVATLEVQLEPKTEAAIRPSLESYSKVSFERIRDEWSKALMARSPSRAFRIMQAHGLLAITAPEIDAMAGCEQNRYHAFDVWNHTLACIDHCEPRLELRLAALLHDLGKPKSREFSSEKRDYTFYGHERIGAKMASALLARLRFSKEQVQRVAALVRHHLVVYDPTWTDTAVRRWIRRVSPELVDDVLLLCRADIRAKGRDVTDELGRIEPLRGRVSAVLAAGAAMGIRDLAISGNDLIKELGMAPGPQMGQILRDLLEKVTDEPGLNQRDVLLERARAIVEN